MSNTDTKQYIREIISIKEVDNADIEEKDATANNTKQVFKVVLIIEENNAVKKHVLHMSKSDLHAAIQRGYL